MNSLLPVFLKLDGRPVLIVGAGSVAAAKLPQLLESGAVITVVAPDVRPVFVQPGVTILRRGFVPSDLDGVWYAVAAATPEVNRLVSLHAAERQIFVNAVDDRENASAYLGAVLRRDGLTLAISTGGAAPALAGLVREALDAVLPEDIRSWDDVAQTLRRSWREKTVPFGERRPLLLAALNRLYETGPPASAAAGSP